jgi:hypothetical protein
MEVHPNVMSSGPATDIAIYAPEVPDPKCFNSRAKIPFGVTPEHVCKAMKDFTDFLGFVDTQLASKQMTRFEEMLMPANFSSLVGEFMSTTIPKYCPTVVKNVYHNGHPDMLPGGKYVDNKAQHAGVDGIEIKASRYTKAWQGHNVEDVWLMVFIFQSGRPADLAKGAPLVRFRFLSVLGAMLTKADWKFAGRSETSRRTITASVLPCGYRKMSDNWIYCAPGLSAKAEANLIPFDGDEG